MTDPADRDSEEQRWERLSQYARHLARQAAPADPLQAEFLSALGAGHLTGRELLLSGYYTDVMQPGVRSAADRWLSMSDQERADDVRAAEAEIERTLHPDG